MPNTANLTPTLGNTRNILSKMTSSDQTKIKSRVTSAKQSQDDQIIISGEKQPYSNNAGTLSKTIQDAAE